MAYSELVKNFNRIRDYMREFYVYGFKSREKYTRKSARSYDDEKRRLESWLGNYMKTVVCPVTILSLKHGKQRVLQMEILRFILFYLIFCQILTSVCHWEKLPERWMSISHSSQSQECLMSRQCGKNSKNMKRKVF